MGSVQTTDLAKGFAGVEVHGSSLRIIFTYRGVRCRESLGLEPTKANIKFAAGLRATIVHEIKTKTFDYRARFPDSKRAAMLGRSDTLKEISLSVLKEKYITIKKVDIGEQTLDRYQSGLSVCIAHLGAERFVSVLSNEDIITMRAELIATRKPSTVNHYLAAFRGMLEFAEQNNYTEKKLSILCKKFKVAKSQPDPLELDEFNQIINHPKMHDSHKNMITLAAYTGLRTGELRALAWEDIDLDAGTITVRRNIAKSSGGDFFKLPKTDTIRTVYLLPPALEALKKQRSHTALLLAAKISVRLDQKTEELQDVRLVFRPSTNLPFDNHHAKDSLYYAESSFREMWKMALSRSKIRYRTVYQLRHTFACWQLTAHGNIAFIAEQMGHSDYSMLVKKYGRWMKTETRNELNRVWSAMEDKGHTVAEKAPIMPQQNQIYR